MTATGVRRWVAVLVSCLMLTALGLVALAATSAVPAEAEAASWSPVVETPVGTGTPHPAFQSVSCSGSGDCTAVGSDNNEEPVYATQVAGVWGSTTELTTYGSTRFGSLHSVSCTSEGDCVAVGQDRNDLPIYDTEDAGSWSTGAEFGLATGVTGSLYGVSCTSDGYCTAVGGDSNGDAIVTTEVNGAWEAAAEVTPPTGASFLELRGVSCYGSGDCVAVGGTDTAAAYAVESGGTWGPVTVLASSVADVFLNGVTCSSAADCTAAGTASPTSATVAVTVSETNGTWGSVETVSTPSGYKSYLNGVSCTSAGNCSAVGAIVNGVQESPIYESESDGVWGPLTSLGIDSSQGSAELDGVSCYGPGDCTGVGFDEYNIDYASVAGVVTYSTPAISGVTFTGGSSDPTVTVSGSGFGASAAVLGAAQAPCDSSSGEDYQSNLYLDDTSLNWVAGQIDPIALTCDFVGLQVLSYSDNKIVFGFGSDYSSYGPLNSGDQFSLSLFGATYSGTVVYGPTLSAVHLSLQAGTSATVAVPGTVLISGATVKVSGPSGLVSVSNVSVNSSGTSASLRLSAPVTATPGAYNLTLTDPNGTSAICNGCLTVTPAAAKCTRTLPAGTVVGMADTVDGDGYWVASSTGEVAACGDAPYYGNGPSGVAAIAAAPSGDGYWLATATGQVYSYGSAVNHGGIKVGTKLNYPVVAMAADPATGGYWLLGGDGGVFSFHAPFFGSTGAIKLDKPAVGMEATPKGNGYWFVASDGGIFNFGRATFEGSLGGVKLDKPVVGMAVDLATGGYWMDASDGGIFAFKAPFRGSTGNTTLTQPCVGMVALPSGLGYRFVAAGGHIFSYGKALDEGSAD